MDPRPKKSGKRTKKGQTMRTPSVAHNISPQPPSNISPQPHQHMSRPFSMPQFANSMPFACPQMPANIEQSPNSQYYGSTSFNQLPIQYPQMLHGGYVPQYFQSQGSNDMSGGMNMFHPMPTDDGSFYASRHTGLLAHMRAEATPTADPVESPASPTSQFPPFSTQDGTPGTEEHSVEDSVEVDSPTGVYGRKRKWYYDDNCALVSAWLKYSIDAEENICQGKDTFWGKITRAVNARVPPREGHGPRTMSTCKNHWNSMIREIMLFVGCFEKECRNAQSGGDSEEFIIKEAHQTYLQRHGKNFYYHREWETLKNEAKWKSLVKMRSKQPESSESGKRARDDKDGGNNWEPSDPLPRPAGIKACKKKSRAGSSNSSTSTAASDAAMEFNRIYAEKVEMTKTHNQLKELMIKTKEDTNRVNADLARANKMTFLGTLMTLDSQGKLTDQQRVIMNSLLEELYGGQ